MDSFNSVSTPVWSTSCQSCRLGNLFGLFTNGLQVFPPIPLLGSRSVFNAFCHKCIDLLHIIGSKVST